LFLMTSSAYGQQFDIKFGLGTVSAPSSSSASGNYSPQSIGGGVYPAFSGDYLFYRKYFGVGAEAAWRASRKSYDLSNPPTPFRRLRAAVRTRGAGSRRSVRTSRFRLARKMRTEDPGIRPPYLRLFFSSLKACCGPLRPRTLNFLPFSRL